MVILKGGVFNHFSAAPIYASFSRAITPAVRSHEYPLGVPHTSPSMKLKLAEGNEHLNFVCKMIAICISLKFITGSKIPTTPICGIKNFFLSYFGMLLIDSFIQIFVCTGRHGENGHVLSRRPGLETQSGFATDTMYIKYSEAEALSLANVGQRWRNLIRESCATCWPGLLVPMWGGVEV